MTSVGQLRVFAGNQTLAALPVHPLKKRRGRRVVAAPHRYHPVVVRVEQNIRDLLFERRVPAAVLEARVSPLDRAFLFGDAVYEVIPVYGGRPFRLREHLDRLNRSLAAIRMPAPRSHPEWAAICAQLACALRRYGLPYLYYR